MRRWVRPGGPDVTGDTLSSVRFSLMFVVGQYRVQRFCRDSKPKQVPKLHLLTVLRGRALLPAVRICCAETELSVGAFRACQIVVDGQNEHFARKSSSELNCVVRLLDVRA